MHRLILLPLTCFFGWTGERPLAAIAEAESETRSASEVMTRFWALDVDADGRVTREEYLRPHGEQPSAAAARVASVRLDLDRDGVLTLVEFAASELDPEMLFRGLDADGDGVLTRAEFLQHCSGESQRSGRAVFYKSDVDGDEQLSVHEFLRQGLGAKIRATNEFRRRDLNDDGRLSPEEYYRPNVGTKWEEKAKQEAVECDLDGDGFLNLVEFALAPPARTASQELFQILDADGDQTLTRDEFLRRFAASEQPRAKERFSTADTNADGRLSPGEYVGMNRSVPQTTAGRFRTRDLNDDGRLSPQEYYGPNLGTKWEQKARQEAVEYDLDRDGFLSLVEFALAPGSNTKPEALFEILDTDSDQKLAEDEFLQRYASNEQPLAAAMFARADTDGDGRLSRHDWLRARLHRAKLDDHGIATREIPAEAIFAARDGDGDGFLLFSDVFSETQPGGPDPAQARAYRKRLMRAEESFAAADLDGDGRLSLKEFQQARQQDRPAATAVTARSARHRKSGINWLLIGFISADVAVLAGAGLVIFRRKRR